MVDWYDVKVVFTGESENLSELELEIDKLIKNDEDEMCDLLKEDRSQVELTISYQSDDGYCHDILESLANRYSLELSGVCVEVKESGADCYFIIGKKDFLSEKVEVCLKSHKDVLAEL